MYEDLIARLRKMSKISAGLSVLLPKAGGNAIAELLEEAADAFEQEGNLTADVRPVSLGRWILDSDPGEPWKYKCNQCGEVTNNTCMGKPRYLLPYVRG